MEFTVGNDEVGPREKEVLSDMFMDEASNDNDSVAGIVLPRPNDGTMLCLKIRIWSNK